MAAVLCPLMIPAVFALMILFKPAGNLTFGGMLAMVGDFRTSLGLLTAFGAIICYCLLVKLIILKDRQAVIRVQYADLIAVVVIDITVCRPDIIFAFRVADGRKLYFYKPARSIVIEVFNLAVGQIIRLGLNGRLT